MVCIIPATYTYRRFANSFVQESFMVCSLSSSAIRLANVFNFQQYMIEPNPTTRGFDS